MYIIITYFGEGDPQIFFCKNADEMAKVMHDKKDCRYISVYRAYESGAVQLIAGVDIRGEMK